MESSWRLTELSWRLLEGLGGVLGGLRGVLGGAGTALEPYKRRLEGSLGHLGAVFWSSGSHVGVIWEPKGSQNRIPRGSKIEQFFASISRSILGAFWAPPNHEQNHTGA